MLKQALAARIPLITCTTTDVLNARKIILHLSGAGSFNGAYQTEFGSDTERDYIEIAENNRHDDKVLVIINPDEAIPAAFNAGEIPVPFPMIRKKLNEEFHVKLGDTDKLSLAMVGLTLKQVDEVTRLSQTMHGELTVDTIRHVRQTTAQVVPGVQTVNTELEHYEVNDEIEMWLETTGAFLHTKEYDNRLQPRGLLMAGIPGTGKTMAAKYIASQLKMTLFRLDVGALQSKYVGESEANLQRALQVVSQNEPCVMLIDEVEKLFQGTDDSGVTANLLAGLLWWLQEHRSRVLTIMTTNDEEKLPSELVRPGRIDRRIEFGPLESSEIANYVVGLLDSLSVEHMPLDWGDFDTMSPTTHAQVTAEVLNAVRKHLLEGKNGN